MGELIELKGEVPAPGEAEGAPFAGDAVDSNYQYWRDHGESWIDGYDRRKKRQVLYHIQELMLTHYMLQHSQSAPTRPMKVLEFGCGVGRHLRNLSRLPDVDVYGFDQSQAMTRGVLRWAGKEWFDSHVTVGMPTGDLPYPDKHFDIVYSAEVLVHVRPEHLDGILKQMVRVCRGHILHMETSEHVKLYTGAHEGCWKHDLVAAYARLGLPCEILPSGYSAHTPYRVKIGEEPRFTWPPAILEMYRRLERDMDEGFEAIEQSAGRQADVAAAAQRELAQQREVNQHQGQELAAAREQVVALTEAAQGHLARAEALAAELGQSQMALAQAQRTLADMADKLSHKTQALQDAEAAFRTRIAELEAARAAEQASAAALLSQRQTFVMAVSKHLRD